MSRSSRHDDWKLATPEDLALEAVPFERARGPMGSVTVTLRCDGCAFERTVPARAGRTVARLLGEGCGGAACWGRVAIDPGTEDVRF